MIPILMMLACMPAPQPLSKAQLREAVGIAEGQDPDALLAQVISLVEAHEKEDPVRHPGGPHRRINGTAWVFDRFTELGLEPWIEETDADGEYPITNVLAEIPGKSKEIVYVTSHHDVWYTPADDNTSGVVAMFAAVEAFLDEDLDRTVRFASFDQEETGLRGSNYHYRNTDLDDVVAVVNMDAIAYADRSPGSQSSPTGFSTPDVADFIAVIGNQPAKDLLYWSTQLGPELPHPLHVIAVYGVGDNDKYLLQDLHRSDQSMAWFEGIPAAFLTDTTNFRSSLYHTEGDTVDSLDPRFFAGSTELVIALAWAAQVQR